VVADEVERALAGLDFDEVKKTYWNQNEFICLERWLPAAIVGRMVAEVERVRPAVHRNYIPRHKKGGSVSFYTLVEQAPTILALYRAPAFIRFLANVTGQPLQPCPESDPHSCALYFYTEPGDHIGFHFDTSYYKGSRYTVLVGLIERSSSRLVCQLFKDDPGGRPLVELQLATHPGTLVAFKGDKLWERNLGPFISQHGPGASPILYKNLLIFSMDKDAHYDTVKKGKLVPDPATLYAFDKKTGKSVWEKPREALRACYSVPFVLERAGSQPELIVTSTTAITTTVLVVDSTTPRRLLSPSIRDRRDDRSPSPWSPSPWSGKR